MPSRDPGRADNAVAQAGGSGPPRGSPLPDDSSDKATAGRQTPGRAGGIRITPHGVWVATLGGFCLAILAGLIVALVLLLN
jgi:hypothetical protein